MRKSNDIRVVRTQKALLEALDQLIKTKKLSCVSITELCSAADINRNTFYYHYNNINDLITENKQILEAELNEVLDVNNTKSRTTINEICKVLKRHPLFLSILVSPNCDVDLFEEIFGIASEKARIQIDRHKEITSASDLYSTYYCNAGCNAVLSAWIRSGMKESPDEVTDIISLSSRKGPISVLFPED